MAYEDFPEDLFFKTCATGELVSAGAATFDEAWQLKYIRLELFKHGAAAGTERVRVKLYHDAELTKLYRSSSWVTLADCDLPAGDWIGRVRFDFDEIFLEASQTYHVAIETDAYTRVGDTYYLAFKYDWPFPLNEQADEDRPGIAMEIYGLRAS